jgi:hypothetical protein
MDNSCSRQTPTRMKVVTIMLAILLVSSCILLPAHALQSDFHGLVPQQAENLRVRHRGLSQTQLIYGYLPGQLPKVNDSLLACGWSAPGPGGTEPMLQIYKRQRIFGLVDEIATFQIDPEQRRVSIVITRRLSVPFSLVSAAARRKEGNDSSVRRRRYCL